MKQKGKLIYSFDHPELIPWAEKIIGFNSRPDAQAIGWIEGDNLRCVAIWDGFSDVDCNIHIASDGKPHWLKRPFLYAAFAHPFVQWDMRRVTGLVPSKNAAALKFDLSLGFKREGLLREACPDDDIVLLGMLRKECRFIPLKYRT